MYVCLEVLTVVLVAGAMAMALAHALELPGKLRLGRQEYFVVQRIYYPGFTIGGGVAEVGGIVTTFALMLTSSGSVRFWLIASALVALLAMQLVFWLMTQPVNKHWLQEVELTSPAKRFFGTEGAAGSRPSQTQEWTVLRNQWELSHVIRAGLAILGLILLTTAIAIRGA
ncbi:anthrone oxygenase family protein [Mesorhizobium sp. J8]|uniref:anthrone oxygenase family protein n=1 Tax=Mesorhizobium sp. J8 TaxID=2777475 RepID=UPI0019155774|nr:anthrone oxygenase family protein [Mesorhizobium sp. J8]BCM18216.1 hypothetical protein MJ8_19820 [Mesorhizobium sp. J8]